jgi:hypothetical protein
MYIYIYISIGDSADSTLRLWIFVTTISILIKVYPKNTDNTDPNDRNNHENLIMKNQILEDLLSGILPPMVSNDFLPARYIRIYMYIYIYIYIYI